MRRLSILATLVSSAVALAMPTSAGAEGGDLLWEDRFGQPGSDEFPAGDALAAAHGAVFVPGSAANVNGDLDFLVRAYDAKGGSLLWDDLFDKAGGFDSAIGIATGGGRVFAMGGANCCTGIPLIRAYERDTGQLLWHKEVADGRGVFDSAVIHKKRVIAVGGNGTWLVSAYEAETGAAIWQDRFGAGSGNRAIDVAEGNGRIYAGGRARPPGAGLNWLVRTYDATTGAVLWQDHTPAGDFAQANSIAVEGNRLIAAGTVRTTTPALPFSNTDWLIRAYNAKTGELLWQRQLDDGGGDNIERAYDVAVLDGRAFVAGTGGLRCNFSAAAPDNCDFIVRTYDIDTGQLVWQDRVDRAPIDQANAIAARGDRVFATGNGANDCAGAIGTNCDFLIRAYGSETGNLLWEDQVDTIGTDEFGTGIAAYRGSVFASGPIFDTPTSLDLSVRAYDAGGDNDDGDEDDD